MINIKALILAFRLPFGLELSFDFEVVDHPSLMRLLLGLDHVEGIEVQPLDVCTIRTNAHKEFVRYDYLLKSVIAVVDQTTRTRGGESGFVPRMWSVAAVERSFRRFVRLLDMAPFEIFGKYEQRKGLYQVGHKVLVVEQ